MNLKKKIFHLNYKNSSNHIHKLENSYYNFLFLFVFKKYLAWNNFLDLTFFKIKVLNFENINKITVKKIFDSYAGDLSFMRKEQFLSINYMLSSIADI